MHTYEEASAYLGRKQDRPLTGRSTRLIRRGSASIAVRYHATDVVTYHDDGRTILNSDGYQTSTTKSRMNDYSPAFVTQHQSVWSVGEHPYTDGMTVLGDGTIIYPDGVDPEAIERERKALAGKIRRYTKLFGQAVAEGQVGYPSGGDCWGCVFQSDAGNFLLGSDHILGHFGGTPDEPDPYFVPSLLFRACQTSGDPRWLYQHLIESKDGRYAASVLRSFLRRVLLEGRQ
jgi:hypothetical protein